MVFTNPDPEDDELPPCNDGWNYIPKVEVKSNCPNCGAPMKNYRCGTERR